MASPQIILYTNHRCPYAHRAHITLEELGLPYEEVIIDLDKPREPWYLKVNPVSSSFSKLGPFVEPMSTSAASSPRSNTATPTSRMRSSPNLPLSRSFLPTDIPHTCCQPQMPPRRLPLPERASTSSWIHGALRLAPLCSLSFAHRARRRSRPRHKSGLLR